MKEFIVKYIEQFRNKIQKTKKTNIKTNLPEIIEKPTQFEILKVIFPERTLYIVLFQQDLGLPDLTNAVLEISYNLNSSENVTENIEKFITYNNLISDNLIQRPEELRKNLYPLVISEILFSQNNFYDFIQKKNIGVTPLIHPIWIFNGELEKMKVEQEVSGDFGNLFLTPEMMRNLLMSSSKKVEPTAKTIYTSYIKPPVWLDNFPQYSVLDELRQTHLSKFLTWIFDETLPTEEGDINIKIRTNGLIQITDALKSTSLDFINLFIGFLVMQGYDIFHLAEHELLSQEFTSMGNVSHNIISSHSFRGEDRGRESKIRSVYYPSWLLPQRFLSIKPEQVKFAYEKAKMYLFQPERFVLKLYLTGFTYFRHSDYNQCFMNSWIVIENHLHRQLQNFLAEKKVSPDRKRKFRRYSVDQVLEILYILEKLDSNDYNSLMKLKRRRNNLIHKMGPISREEAQNCLSRAKYSICDQFFSKDAQF